MEHSPSWEANNCLIDQEISHILWNLKFITISLEPATGLYLSQMNPAHLHTLFREHQF
jgi:hypothetical protein